MIKLNLNKNEKYILACSYGPDSMCLFDLLLKGKYCFEIAHVNYHLREEEPKEMQDLKKICKIFKIPLHIIDVSMPNGVNEEGWARQVRYDYFSEIADELKIFNVLVAHNQDDLIETFYLQQKRNNVVSFYGLKETTKYKNINIIRPLLNYKKSVLREYCDENKVHYGIDWSNYDTSYERNEIRKNIVSLMDDLNRKKVLEEIENLNNVKEKRRNEISKLITESNGFFVQSACMLSYEDIQSLLIFIFEKKGIYWPVSKEFAKEFSNILKNNQNWHLEIDKNTFLCVDYGYVGVYTLKNVNYEFGLDKIEPYFKLNTNSPLYKKVHNEGVLIKSNLRTNETYILPNGVKKKIGRCFIDWKIPYVYRKIWPGIYNNSGELIYVPRYQKVVKNEEHSPLIFNIEDFVN